MRTNSGGGRSDHFPPKLSQMKTYDQFSHLLVSLPSNLWSWWWEGSESSIAAVTLSFVVLLILFWYGWMIYRSKKDNLPLPPGPRGLPLVGNLPFLDPELHTYFNKLSQTYGPIFKIQLGNKLGVVVSSPSLAKEVLQDHDITFANSDVPLAALAVTYGGSDIVWNPYGPEWRMLRRVCVREMLCNQSLDGVYFLRRREVRQMVKHFYNKNGSPVDVGEQMFVTVLNVITSMLWGGKLEAEGGDERTALGTEFRQVVTEIAHLLGEPNILDFFPSLARFYLQGIQKQMGRLFVRFDRIFELIIQKRLKTTEAEDANKANDGHEKKKDFLQFLLKLKDEKDPKTPFTMIHLKALFMDMVVGGTETTSNTVEWAIAEMMNNPETIRKAQEELERIVGKGNSVEEHHIPQLNYLQLVMKEVLRLHPGLPLLVPHCPSSSCTVGGYMIPKGARVFVNVWAIHRDPSLWDNPSDFNPGRFSNSNGDYTGKDFNYFPFGSGRRICAGIPLAERMFIYELATLLHLFDWRLPDGEKLNLKDKFGIVTKKETPLIAVATPRFSDPALYDA